MRETRVDRRVFRPFYRSREVPLRYFLHLTGGFVRVPPTFSILARGTMANIWSDEKTEALISLIKQGYSGGMIAGLLGVSRSAVSGKASRLHLQLGDSRNAKGHHRTGNLRNPQRSRFNKYPEIKAKSKPRYENAPIIPPHIDDIPRIKFPELEPHHCRFPVGNPRSKTFGFCGLERIPGRPYCAAHILRTHTPVPVKTRPALRETAGVKIDA